jgi:hypothetical protein
MLLKIVRRSKMVVGPPLKGERIFLEVKKKSQKMKTTRVLLF